MFIVVGEYVGYHVSQQITVEDGEGHNITVDLEILDENTGSVKILQYN